MMRTDGKKNERRLGCHLSIAGGVHHAAERAVAIGCTAFQLFTRSPRGWQSGPLPSEDVAAFRQLTGTNGPYPVAHMPYLPNLAGPDGDNFKKSVAALISELERCTELGIDFLVTHLGSHLGLGEEAGRMQIVTAIRAALDQAQTTTQILMENTAGTKNSLGTTPADLALILDALDGEPRVGVCIDTAHAFAAGYDWRTDPGALGRELKAAGILDRVHVLHFNDSAVPLGGHADRHAHLGLGEIGLEGLTAILKLPDYRSCPVILETPVDATRNDVENVAIARTMISARPMKI